MSVSQVVEKLSSRKNRVRRTRKSLSNSLRLETLESRQMLTVLAADDHFDVPGGAENHPLPVLSNDFSTLGEDLLITSVTQPEGGEVTITENGRSIQFTADDSFHRAVHFDYTVTDGDDEDVAHVFLTPRNNNGPAVDDEFEVLSASQDNPLDVLANDVIGHDGYVLGVIQPELAMVDVVDGGQLLLFTPNPQYAGPVTFTYLLGDASGLIGQAEVTVQVVNPSAVDAQPDEFTVQPGNAITILDVLSNDQPAGGLLITSVSQPNSAFVEISQDGQTLLFAAAPGSAATQEFSYTVSDGNGNTDTTSVIVHLEPNGPQFAFDDFFVVQAGPAEHVLNVLANDPIIFIPEQGPIVEVSQPTTGQVIINGFQSSLTYLPHDPNAAHVAEFEYWIATPSGDLESAVVVVEVIGITGQVDAQNDEFTVDAGTQNNILNVLENDVPGADLSIVEVSQVVGGEATIVENGQLISFTPWDNFEGAAFFSYAVSDGNGGTDVAEVVVHVEPRQQFIVNPDHFVFGLGQTEYVLDVLANDDFPWSPNLPGPIVEVSQPSTGTVTIIENGTLLLYEPTNPNEPHAADFGYLVQLPDGTLEDASVTVVLQGQQSDLIANPDQFAVESGSTAILDVLANDQSESGMTILEVSPAQGADITIVENGTLLSFTPWDDFVGPVEFQYVVANETGDVATTSVFVAVTPGQQPQLVDDFFQVEGGQQQHVLDVLQNDNIVWVQGPIVSVTQPTTGEVLIVQDSSLLVYVPANPNVEHEAVFTYSVAGNNGAVLTAEVIVHVIPQNTHLEANPDDFVVSAGSTTDLDVLANDTPANGLTIVEVTQPDSGHVEIGPNGDFVVFTADANAFGPTFFNYQVVNSDGEIATGEVFVFISPVQEGFAEDDEFHFPNGGTRFELDVLFNDAIVTPGGGLAQITAVTAPNHGDVAIVQNGSLLVLEVETGFTGEVVFSYTVTLNGVADEAEVVVHIGTPNTAIEARPDQFVAFAGESILLDVLGNDSPDGLVISTLANPDIGSWEIVENGQFILFTPDANMANMTLTFEYTAADSQGNTASTHGTVIILPGNGGGDFAVDDFFTIETGTQQNLLDVLANDAAAGPNGGLTITDVSTPNVGEVSIVEQGQFLLFSAPAGFVGDVEFTYTVAGPDGVQDEAVVLIHVMGGPNHEFEAVPDQFAVTVGEPTVLDLLANDIGDNLTILEVQQIPGVEIDIIQNGALVSFLAGPNAPQQVEFTYVIQGPNGDVSSAQVFVVLTPPTNNGPQDDFFVFDPSAVNGGMLLDVLANDNLDPAANAQILEFGQPQHGEVVSEAGGTALFFIPEPGFVGEVSFNYWVGVAGAVAGPATVTIVVEGPDTPGPTIEAIRDHFVIDAGAQEVALNLLDNDFGTGLLITEASQPHVGTVTIGPNADMVFFSPPENFTGPVQFVYQITNANGETDSASVVIFVLPSDDSIVQARPDQFGFMGTGGEYVLDVLLNDRGDQLRILEVGQPNHGQVQIVEDGHLLVLQTEAGFSGLISFPYAVADSFGNIDEANVFVSIAAPNNVADLKDHWRNDENPADVDGNGELAARDALLVVNQLNETGATDMEMITMDGSPVFLDVSGDRRLSPQDAVMVVNALNNREDNPSPRLELVGDQAVEPADVEVQEDPAVAQAEARPTAAPLAEPIPVVQRHDRLLGFRPMTEEAVALDEFLNDDVARDIAFHWQDKR